MRLLATTCFCLTLGLSAPAAAVEWTNVTTADRIKTRGTYADWGISRP
jgi:hypothetical protein